MSNALGIFRSNGDPSSVGLVAGIGQLARNILTGLDYAKVGTGDTAWILASLMFGGSFQGVGFQKFTTAGAGTYTPTTGMKFAIAIVTGAGGGGGGADTDGTAGNCASGGGGGAGGTAIEILSAAVVGASQAVNVGTAGAAGAIAGGDGGTGGTSSIGTIATGIGGVGGTGSGSASAVSVMTSAGGDGGSVTFTTGHGVIGGPGGRGEVSACDGTTKVTVRGTSGVGGASWWGGGGRAITAAVGAFATAVNFPGADASPRGAGGSGAVCFASTTGAVGGLGRDGIIYIVEFLGAA